MRRDGRYVEANEAALAFWDRSAEDMLGSDFWHDFPAEVAGLVDDAFSSEARVEGEVVLEIRGAERAVVAAIVPCRIGEVDSFFCLCTDITAHRLLEERLRDTNTALRVVLEQVNDDKVELERRVMANLELLITPTLDRLARQLRSRPEIEFVDALRENLADILRPFAARLSSPDEAPRRSHDASSRSPATSPGEDDRSDRGDHAPVTLGRGVPPGQHPPQAGPQAR